MTTNSTTATSAKEIRERRAKITPAPWFAWYTPDGRIGSTITKQSVCDADNWRTEWKDNQAFIADAPTDIDFLLAANEQLRGEVGKFSELADQRHDLLVAERREKDDARKLCSESIARTEALEARVASLRSQLTACKQETWGKAIEIAETVAREIVAGALNKDSQELWLRAKGAQAVHAALKAARQQREGE